MEFDGLRRDVGHVEFGQHFFCGFGIVVGGTAHQRKTSERNQRVDRGAVIFKEVFVDGGSAVQARCKAGDDAQSARFEGCDHAVVVTGVVGQQVRAQHQQTHRAMDGSLGGRGQGAGVFAEAAFHARVVDAHFRVFNRRLGFEHAAQVFALAAGAAIDHMADQVEHVGIGAAQPVLQGHEIGTHILRCAGDEAQHLWNAAQHLELGGTTGAVLFFFATQFFQQGHGAAGGLAHVKVAQARQLHHLGGRGHANHRVAAIAALAQGGQDGQKVVFQKQHARHDDVRLGNVGLAALDGGFVVGKFGRGVQGQVQAGHFACQAVARTLGGTGQMRVHGDDGHPHRCVATLGHGVSG